jgi:hypothetical protein
MKNQLSICNVVDQSCHDHTKQRTSPTLHQTSIRTYFTNAPKGNKRPVSAISGTTCLLANGISKTPARVCTKFHNKGNGCVSPHSVNDSIENETDRVLHDSTNSHTITAIQSKSTSATSPAKVTTLQRKQKQQSQQQPLQQLYIDFGQRNFAATNICPTCGMLYVHGVQSDIKRHEKFCQNYQDGVSWSLTTTTTSVSKRSRSNELPNPNRKQHLSSLERVCYEWILPKSKTKMTLPERIVSRRHLPISTTSKTPNQFRGRNRVFDDAQRACIVEVRTFYHVVLY